MGVNSSIDFCYDGVWASDMGLINVNTQDSGLFQEVFVPDREIKEVIVRHRKKPYYQRIQDNPITLTLRCAFADTYDKDSIRKITKWLCGDGQYKELYFSDNPDRIFYAMYIGTNPQLQHNGLGEGYFTIPMRCDAPYSYSASNSEVYDFSTLGSGNIQFLNLGDFSVFPELEITKYGNNNGDIVITNTSNGGQQFILKSAKYGSSSLSIVANIIDGMTVQIGRDVYEFDTDNSVNTNNIKVSVPSADLSATTAMNNLVQVINSTTSKVENVTATYSNDTITVTSNVMGDKMPVGTNFPSIIVWDDTQIDGSGIMDQEIVYFDNENQIIISSLPNTYRFDAFNNNYLEMVEGMNYLTVQGYCKLEFRWRNLTIQG